ncbi:MAG TPA: hypothetical protein PKE46_12775 [Micropruina sp.]|nr:hypothetical protein [Propionibacterium sp.]HMR23002.1 hypothetical protein [Micropruina sp.]
MASTLRRLGASLCVPLALALTGCGMNVQTLQPYTPAEGVNSSTGPVMVRNLLIVADNTGRGVVSASLVTYGDDTLTAVAGVPQKSDGTPGSPLVVTTTGLPVQLSSNTLVVLTNAPVRIAVTSPDLKPGLLADVTLTFTKGGPVKLVAPVVSASEPEYESITVG